MPKAKKIVSPNRTVEIETDVGKFKYTPKETTRVPGRKMFFEINPNLYAYVYEFAMTLPEFPEIVVTDIAWDQERLKQKDQLASFDVKPNVFQMDIAYEAVVLCKEKPVIISYDGELYMNIQNAVSLFGILSKDRSMALTVDKENGLKIKTANVPIAIYKLFPVDFLQGGLTCSSFLQYIQYILAKRHDQKDYAWFCHVRETFTEENDLERSILKQMILTMEHVRQIVPNHAVLKLYADLISPNPIQRSFDASILESLKARLGTL